MTLSVRIAVYTAVFLHFARLVVRKVMQPLSGGISINWEPGKPHALNVIIIYWDGEIRLFRNVVPIRISDSMVGWNKAVIRLNRNWQYIFDGFELIRQVEFCVDTLDRQHTDDYAKFRAIYGTCTYGRIREIIKTT